MSLLLIEDEKNALTHFGVLQNDEGGKQKI